MRGAIRIAHTCRFKSGPLCQFNNQKGGNMNTHKYNLGDQIELVKSNESGTIIGVAFYEHNQEVQYLVRYKSGDGRLVEEWWGESAILKD